MPSAQLLKVTCALIYEAGLVLVTQRSETMPEPLRWEFPGGKMEAGETEEACLVREIREELSIEITPQKRLTPVLHQLNNGKTLELIPYRCGYTGGTIRLLEHKAYHWAKPEELTRYDWCAPDVPIVTEFLQLINRR